MRLLQPLSENSLALTTYLISSLFAGLCVFLAFIFIDNGNRIFYFSLIPVLYFVGIHKSAPLSSPDTMAAFLGLLCLFYLKNSKWVQLIMALAVLPLIRTDFIILPALIFTCLVFRKKFALALASFVPSFVTYTITNKLNSNYGYLKIFNFTLIEITPYPEALKIETQIQPYLDAYTQGWTNMFSHRHFIIYVAFFVYWYIKVRPQKKPAYDQMVFIIIGFVIMHMILFPAYYERFFIFPATLSGIYLTFWFWEQKYKNIKAI
jgi:hypothetical protein